MKILAIIIYILTGISGIVLGNTLGGRDFSFMTAIYTWISGGLLGTVFLGFALLLDRHDELMGKMAILESELRNTIPQKTSAPQWNNKNQTPQPTKVDTYTNIVSQNSKEIQPTKKRKTMNEVFEDAKPWNYSP